jgi:nicotinamide-nucleotide amidase
MTGDAAKLIAQLNERGLSLAVAESLTGGLLAAALVGVPGASTVFRGGVIAYNTALKASILGVDPDLLAEHGPVHPEVARQMALGVRRACAVDGVECDVAIATTGVAGPGPQDGHPAGEVYVGFAVGSRVHTLRLSLKGDREAIRNGVVTESLAELTQLMTAETSGPSIG